jgi:hypothetical protein
MGQGGLQQILLNCPGCYFIIENARERKYEEICHIANGDFRHRWIGTSKDQLFSHLRPFPDLH